MGLTRQVAGPTAQHLEGGHPVPNWHVGTVVTLPAVAGNPIVLTVSANDVINGTVFPDVGESVRFQNTYSGQITNKQLVGGLWQVTILPHDPSWLLTAAVGDGVWMIDQLSAEGSQTPNNSKVVPSETVSYPLQIIRNSEQITGSAELTELWTDRDQFGNPINPMYLETLLLEMRHTVYWSNATFFGHPNLNPSNIDGNRMYGMDYTVSNGGYTQQYPNGQFTLVEIQNMARVAIKRSSGTEFVGFGGPDFTFAANAGLMGVFSQNPALYETNGGGSPLTARFNDMQMTEKTGIKINIRRVNWAGINFDWIPIQQWGQTQTGGETGFKESGYCFWIPMSKGQTVQGQLVDRFKITERAYGGKTRKLNMWRWGGAAPENKNGYDGQIIECLSEVGTEYYGIDKFMVCKPF